MAELPTQQQLLEDIGVMQTELIHNNNNNNTMHGDAVISGSNHKETTDTPQSSLLYHQLSSSLDSTLPINPQHHHNDSVHTSNIHSHHDHSRHHHHHHHHQGRDRPLVRYNNELLVDHGHNMRPISIAIVGECQSYVLRLAHCIASGRIVTDSEFQQLPSTLHNHRVRCPYRTRLIPIELSCFCDAPQELHATHADAFARVQVWIMVVSPEIADLNSFYAKYDGQWNNFVSKCYGHARRIVACVQPVDHLSDETSSAYHLSNFVDVKLKHVALYSMSSINELFEKAIASALDDTFCAIMKHKYKAHCVGNIKHASRLWRVVDRLSPCIWALNLVLNLMLVGLAFAFHHYTFAVLFACVFLLLNLLLTYQLVKIYCRSDELDAVKLMLVFLLGFWFGFLIPLFAYVHSHSQRVQQALVAYIRTDIDESSLNDFSANVPIRRSCWGFAMHSIACTLPFTFLQVLMMILSHDDDHDDGHYSAQMVAILLVNMVTLLINSWCLIFTRTDSNAFIFAWICVVLDTFSGVLSILLTFHLALPADDEDGDGDGTVSAVVSTWHRCWWLKVYVCILLSLGFEFLNIAESWEHITSGFFELLDHFRSYVSPVPRLQCVGAILAIVFISLGGLIIFFIFQSLGMLIFMFALYFLNWSWCLSLLDDSVMHEFDELYSSLIRFILTARNRDDYALRLSVVNYELNPFTKKMKHVNYELLDMVHLRPKDWLFHGKKYFAEHFLWGAIGGYHYQMEKWLDLKQSYAQQQQQRSRARADDDNEAAGEEEEEEERKHDSDNDDNRDVNNDNPSGGVVHIPCNEKFPRLFWIGFFGCSAYVFQPLYTLVIVFSNLYPVLVYVSLWCSGAPQVIPAVVHIMMACYVLLIPCFCVYVHKAGLFAYTLFHIVSARKNLYKRPRQLFEKTDQMKFFARVWKHYIYVHVTLLRNQMVEEYFGDLYKEMLSLLSPLQRMDNLIQLYEEMYDSHCGRVKIKFADWDEEKHEHDTPLAAVDDIDIPTTTMTMSAAGESNHSVSIFPRHGAGGAGSYASSSFSRHSHEHEQMHSLSTLGRNRFSRKQNPRSNALFHDAAHKKRRRLRKTKNSMLLLDRSLIDLIDNSGAGSGGPLTMNDDDHHHSNDDMNILHRESVSDLHQLRSSIVSNDEIDSDNDEHDEEREPHRNPNRNPEVELEIEEKTSKISRFW